MVHYNGLVQSTAFGANAGSHWRVADRNTKFVSDEAENGLALMGGQSYWISRQQPHIGKWLFLTG